MHIQFLIEDMSGEVLIRHVMGKLLIGNGSVTYDCKAFKGIGGFKKNIEASIVIVLDNDQRNIDEFRDELHRRALWAMISIDHVFCIAVEEMEAWLLGDRTALFEAYPNARESAFREYEQDSICGTWEVLANVVYKGGLKKFKKDCPSYGEIGKYKSKWADEIGKYMNIDNNISPSFNYFLSQIRMRIK